MQLATDTPTQLPVEHPGPSSAVRPFTAIRAGIRAIRNPEDTASGARLVAALDGDNPERIFQRFRRDPLGARLLRERPRLVDRLNDRETLHALAPESLGRCYVEFMEREGISAVGLREAVEEGMAGWPRPDQTRQYVYDRVGDQHDLWHVVTGYSRDLIGELALIEFTHEQVGTPAFAYIGKLAYTLAERRAPGTRRLMEEGRRRAKAAQWLPVQDWERLLGLPLTEVRRELCVGEPSAYVRYYRSDKHRGIVPEHHNGTPVLRAGC